MRPIQRILVPTDFSECSGAAAAVADQLAKQIGAAIELVTVVDTSPLQEAYGDEAFRNERIAHIRGVAEQKLEQFAQRHFPAPRAARLHVRDGNTLSEILAAARDTGSDLIVMGTQGRTGLTHLLIGSVAEKVVRHSEIPVITVRPSRPE
jgi:nucleotide-binding universal stress UspA family protein